jgi:DNA-binding NarL/FixJ family response regulator
MVELAEGDLRALQEFDVALAAIDHLGSLGSAALGLIGKLVPCDYATYNEIDVRRRRTVVAVEPFDGLDGTDYSAFQRYVGQHPVVTYSRRTGDGSAHTISDFLDRRSFHRTDLYANFFRDARAEHQAAITLTYTPSLVVGIALNRARGDFNSHDRLLLNLVRSHLVVAHRNLSRLQERDRFIAALESSLADQSRGVILTSPTGTVIEASDEARRLLASHRGVTLTPGSDLPARIAAIIVGAPSRSEPLVLAGQNGHICFRYLARSDEGHCIIAVDERTWNEPPPLAAANLTAREHGILAMLASSMDNRRIAAELGVSVRTVHKHLEHIYAKLDVGDRTSAAARWFSDQDRS